MPNAATSEVLMTVALAAARNAAVAAEAGVDPIAWAGTVSGHVFDHRAGWIGGRNRGRLPFIEVDAEPTEYDRTALPGGEAATTVVFYVHTGGKDQRAAQNLAERILAATLAIFRNSTLLDPFGDYAKQGDDLPASWETTPLGHMLVMRSTVLHSFCREDYELADFDPNQGGDVGAVKTINFDDVSPVLLVDIPDTHALDNIEARLLTTFDDPAATITIGIVGDQERYYSASIIDLDGPLWNYVRDFDEAGPLTIQAWLTPGASTQGAIRVQITATPIGS